MYAFLASCLKFYRKRLRVAHQHISKYGLAKKTITRLHLAILRHSTHSSYGSGAKIIGENSNFGPIPASMVPVLTGEQKSPFSPSEIEFELSMLGLAEIFATDKLAIASGELGRVDLKHLRKLIAHRPPRADELAYCVSLFKGTHEETFLNCLIE